MLFLALLISQVISLSDEKPIFSILLISLTFPQSCLFFNKASLLLIKYQLSYLSPSFFRIFSLVLPDAFQFICLPVSTNHSLSLSY